MTTEPTPIVDQPPPTTNDSTPIWDLVVADMQERHKIGVERYGTALQAWNGRDALVDAYQETLDQAVYLRQAIEERATLSGLSYEIDGLAAAARDLAIPGEVQMAPAIERVRRAARSAEVTYDVHRDIAKAKIAAANARLQAMEREVAMADRATSETIKVLDHGYVTLTDWMGDDRTPAKTARTSFHNQKSTTPEQDEKLTDYLVRNRHTTPLEFCQVRFYMKMPIFVARQLVRHRTASINEISLRYVTASEDYYVPDVERCQRQSEINKQGSAPEIVDNPRRVREIIRSACEDAYNDYQDLLSLGLAKELARVVIPMGFYTEWYWQSDLHNFLHMLGLRLDPHAQYEIRVYAQAMLDLVRPLFPTIIASWEASRQK